MPITTLTSREFNQDTGRAKKAAARGPVFITDRGRTAHVLLSAEEYQRLTRHSPKITDLIAMPADPDIAFEPPKVEITLKPADLA